ncbi:35202_t:CDS:2, partial [Racocetra persica]
TEPGEETKLVEDIEISGEGTKLFDYCTKQLSYNGTEQPIWLGDISGSSLLGVVEIKENMDPMWTDNDEVKESQRKQREESQQKQREEPTNAKEVKPTNSKR